MFFSELPSDDQVEIVSSITDREIHYIVHEMDFDDKIDILEELPATSLIRYSKRRLRAREG